jgi:uncharacterized lipoprotein YddW (UPF0748 family)
LFVSLIQKNPVFSSRKSIDELVDFASRAGISTLFVQVYREGKAWFPTKLADTDAFDDARALLKEDPFALLIAQAHARNIKVHAWLNLLSLSRNQNSYFLKRYGADVLTRNAMPKRALSDYLIDSQYFLEPSDQRVRDDLAVIVDELVRAYPLLDGIQFDYIRYPDKDPHYGYAPDNIARFKQAAGVQVIDEDSAAWKQWRRAKVTELLALLVSTARRINPAIAVSATGCMPYPRAFAEAYQDWPGWINSSLVDFVTIMDYSPQPAEFRRWLIVAKQKVGDPSKITVAVGAYKLLRNPAVFRDEIEIVRGQGFSCAVFHYGSLIESRALKSAVIAKNKIHRNVQ